MGLYDSLEINRVSGGGGSEQLEIDSNAAQGSDIPCREAFIVGESANAGVVRVEIGDVCGAAEGIPVPEFGTHHFVLRIPVSNLNLLYFYGSVDTDKVAILYRL